MYTTGWSKVDVLLIAFLHLWLKFCKGIDKYWIVPIRKSFYFHHWGAGTFFGVRRIFAWILPNLPKKTP